MILNGKKVLVTGADGFIGSHLAEALVRAGAGVCALSQYNSLNSWGWLDESEVKNDMEMVSGDIRDSRFVRGITKNVDVVFHLAALISIPYSYSAPEPYIQTNIVGTLNVMQAALDHGVAHVLHTSTSEVYGTARFVPMTEEHPFQAQSPYSASKIGADAIAASFSNSFNLPLTIVRPFNTYGPRQSARAVIPTVITQVLSGKKTIKLGSLTPTRDFNYVEDTCKAFLLLAERAPAKGETVNVGSNFEMSVDQVVKYVRELTQADFEVEEEQRRLRPQDSEVQRLWCDNSKLRNLTGFAPAFTMKEGLKKTIEWFKLRDPSAYKVNRYNV